MSLKLSSQNKFTINRSTTVHFRNITTRL